MKNILIVAGEKSGEEHALSFLPSLQQQNSDLSFFGVGGDLLSECGVELFYHLRDFSEVGLTEVVKKIPFFLKAMNCLVDEAQKRECRYAILIDFQEFNYRLSAKLKKCHIEVFYYVAPQAWGWREGRAYHLNERVHTLFTILPFEKQWFMSRGVKNVHGVQHPLMIQYKNELSDLSRWKKNFYGDEKRALKLLLLPGSRNKEVSSLLSLFVQAGKALKKKNISVEMALVTTTSVHSGLYEEFQSDLDYLYDSKDLLQAIKWADFALASSGTVTLTTALFQLPTIVCYKLSKVTEWLFGLLINYKGPISLANIVSQKMIFPELLQEFATVDSIVPLLLQWIGDRESYLEVQKDLEQLPSLLSGDELSVSDYITQIIKKDYESL